MTVNLFNRTRMAGLKDYREPFELIFARTLEFLGKKEPLTVSVIFVKDRKIHQINREYRHIDRPTDVISFALSDNRDEGDYIEEELGDIFISVDAARRQADEYGHSLKREICFLFTHGLLHLNGFDHQTAEEEKEMISYQKLILDDIVAPDDGKEELC